MRKFQKLSELRIDLIKSLGIALLSPMGTIIFMGIIDKSYFSDKLSLVGASGDGFTD
jgi:hypothetical protein